MPRDASRAAGRSRVPAPLGLALLACLVLSCGRGAAPLAPAPPPAPNPGDALFFCGGWSPAKPTVEEATFDLHITGTEPLAAIRAADGTILHEYQVSLVRARMPVDAIPGLFGASKIWSAREVDPGDPLEFEGGIALPLPLSDADREFLESLGVREIEESTSGHWIAAIIPDPAVTAIRSRAGVAYLDMNSFVCVAGAPGEPRFAPR